MTANTTTPRPTAHAACDHPLTKSARAKCRRDRNKVAEAGNLVSIHTVVEQATEAYLAAASITAPNGTVIELGDIVTLTDSKVRREVVAIADGATITARRIDGGTRQVEVTTDKLNGVKVVNA